MNRPQIKGIGMRNHHRSRLKRTGSPFAVIAVNAPASILHGMKYLKQSFKYVLMIIHKRDGRRTPEFYLSPLLKTIGTMTIFLMGLLAPIHAANPIYGTVQTNQSSAQLGGFNITTGAVSSAFYLPYLTAGLCNTTDSNGKVITTSCGSGSGGGSGTITTGTKFQVPYYSAVSSNIIAGSADITVQSGVGVMISTFTASSGTVTNFSAYNLIGTSITDSNLPTGQCVQTTTGGLLTVTGSACSTASSAASSTNTWTGGNTFISTSTFKGLVSVSTITESSDTVTSINAGSIFGASLATCGDISHAVSWTGGQFGCQNIAGGSSSLSTLEVFMGVARTSPTVSLTGYSGDFLGSVINSTTFQMLLNPATTDFIHNQTGLQSNASFNVAYASATNAGFTYNVKVGSISFNNTNNALYNSLGNLTFWQPTTNASVYAGNGAGTGWTGTNNTGIGEAVMFSSGTGNNNVGVGLFALDTSSTSVDNVAVGFNALSNVMGQRNVVLGSNAGNPSMAVSSNVYVGYGVGFGTSLSSAITTGSGNTFIGYEAGAATSAVINNSIAIGIGAVVTSSNVAQIGGPIGSGLEVNLLVSTLTVSVIHGPYLMVASSQCTVTVSSGTSAVTPVWATTNLSCTVNVPRSGCLVDISATGTLEDNLVLTGNAYSTIFRGTTNLGAASSNYGGFYAMAGTGTGATISIMPANMIYQDSGASVGLNTYSVRIDGDSGVAATWNASNGVSVMRLETLCN